MAYSAGEYSFAVDLLYYGIHPWTITGAVRRMAGTGDHDKAAADIGLDFGVNFLPVMTTQGSLVRCRVKELLTGEQGITVLTGAGTITAGSTLPNNVAMCLSLSTSLAGRSGRGRMYLGAVGDSALITTDHNGWNVAARSNAVTAAEGFMTDLAASHAPSGDEYAWCVWTRTLAQLWSVQAISVDPYVDTQRRRVRD